MNTWHNVRRLVVVVSAAMVLAAPMAYAQEATLSGIVTDATGGVLPGVMVKAVNEATGNNFEAVTDEAGRYRLALRVGNYRISAELAGFSSVIRTGLELLVGQQAVVNLQLSPASVQESVTVTGEAPLLDHTTSSLGSNIDPRQMQELPLNGRNWMELALLAAGNRSNTIGSQDEFQPRTVGGTFQLNLDGQQITNSFQFGGQGQPHFSRDSIAEFEFVSSRFDASQGRSSGVQVNAITKSGTNAFSGSIGSYFRNNRFIAEDFIEHRVLPYSDTQISTTFGGPLRKDKIHFFANYEYEREPQTFTYSSVFPSFNVDQHAVRRERKGGVRLDQQFSPKTRMSVRMMKYWHLQPIEGAARVVGGATNHPSGANSTLRTANTIQGTLSKVIGQRTVNELKVGYAGYYWIKESNAGWADSPTGTGFGAPQINFIGYRIGQGTTNVPLEVQTPNYSLRNDFATGFSFRGSHNMKLGGEYLYNDSQGLLFCSNRVGTYDAQGGPIPANFETFFPVWNDVSTWNLAAISPIVRRYTTSTGDCHTRMPQHIWAAWLQDDWQVTRNVTVNLGLRYDLTVGAYAEWVSVPGFVPGDRADDTNNVGPRLGINYALGDRTAIRAGFGKYYGQVQQNVAQGPVIANQQVAVEVLNDNTRPNFAADPFNGPRPTHEQALARVCDVNPVAGCLRRTLNNLPGPDAKIPNSYQASIGVQRQLTKTSAFEADYVYNRARDEAVSQNVNLAYDPATGVNYRFTDIARRPFPNFGTVNMNFALGRSSYHGLQTSFTKRMSSRWQMSASYTLSGFWDSFPKPQVLDIDPATGALSFHEVPFEVPRDLGGEWTLAATDQRHRAVFNAIWQLGYGFQLSAVHLYGSGFRFANSYGGDPRATGASGSRLRPDGSIVPRNSFIGRPVHKTDLRMQKSMKFGHVRLDGILEVFNVFNHANFSDWVTQESLSNFGQPSGDPVLSNTPRMLQLGFRAGF